MSNPLLSWLLRYAVEDRVAPRTVAGRPRSPHWPKFRDEFLRGKACAACGKTESLNAHHILAYHLHPELELVASNLCPLCEAVTACHYVCGHRAESWSVNTTDPWKVAEEYGRFLKKIRDPRV